MRVEFEGWLMSRDIPLARFEQGELHALRGELLPFHFVRGGSLEDWLRSRAMDCRSRTNARLLRKALGISDEAPELIPLRVNAATITDTYWLKPKGSDLQYQDVCFQENAYWKFALNGPGADFLKDWQNLMLFYRVPIHLPALAPGQLTAMAAAIRCEVDKEKAVAFLEYRYDHMRQAIERRISVSTDLPVEL